MKPQNYAILLAIIASWGIHLSLSAQTGVFVCPGDSALLTIDSTGGTLQWQISPDGIAWFNLPGGTTDSFKVAPDSGFFYRGEVHFNNCNPGYSDTLQIWIADSVQGTAGNDTLICLGDSAQLGGQPTAWGGAGGYQYHWSPGNWLDDSTSANPFAFPPDSTVFYLEVRDSLNCSLFLDTVRVHVLDPLNDSVVYNFSGMVDTFLVPRCIDSLYLELFGAEGNRGGGGDIGYGGLGGYSGGTLLNVAPGDTFYIYVGGQGGWNGGGPGGNGGPNASGNGGGGSDVRRGGSSLLNRIVVAGGGGGGAGGPQQSCAQGPGGSGGSGGAHTGGTGTTGAGCNPGGEGGFGGSSTNGGLGGLGNANCNIQAGTGTQGSFGVGGQGGDGTIGCFGYTGSGGGGGGGGWFGGGGGGGGAGGAAGAWSGGGGGGGSSYIGGMSYGFMYQGVNRGDGKIVIKW